MTGIVLMPGLELQNSFIALFSKIIKMLMENPQQKTKINNQGNHRSKGRRSAPKAETRQTGKTDPIAFIFEDKYLGKMPVLNTANAWWGNPVKVQSLVDAYKFYATDDQACYYAGITPTQLQYFQKFHPDFYRIKHLAKQYPILQAKQALFSNVSKDKESAKWLLARLEKETFSSRTESTGANGRDLFDGMTNEYKKLVEDIRKSNDGETEEENQEHVDKQPTGDIDTGQGGDRDETTSSNPEPSA